MCIQNRSFYDFDVWELLQIGCVSTGDIVDHGDLVSTINQRFRDVGANEPGTTRNRVFRHLKDHTSRIGLDGAKYISQSRKLANRGYTRFETQVYSPPNDGSADKTTRHMGSDFRVAGFPSSLGQNWY